MVKQPARSLLRTLHHTIYVRRQLQSIMVIVIVCASIGTVYEPITSGVLTLSGPLVGVLVGLPLVFFEVLFPMNFMRRWSFIINVIAKSFLYIALLWLVFISSTFFYGLIHGLTLSDFNKEIWSRSTFNKVGVAFGAFIIIIFFRQLNHLIGTGNLIRYFFGGYHRPGREARIFMFLDLKDSTAIAERLYIDDYYALLNDFFHDIAEPILATKAQIYQYIGDEVVLTWPMKKGLNNANCILVFYEIDSMIKRRAHYYLAHYGLIPQYKAGIHGGEVIRAEIGDLKRDLIYNGDVLNTTARIRSECNRFNARLLISSTLFEQLKLPSGIIAENLGNMILKGKRHPIGLVRLSKGGETPYPDLKTASPSQKQKDL